MLYSNFVPMPATGEVAGVSTYAQGSSLTFNMYQLRPTGVANQYEVVYDSGTIHPSGDSGSVQDFAFPNGPTSVHPGDVFAHYGRGIPWSASGETNAVNAVAIYYPSSSAPTQGNSITLGSGAFPQSTYVRDYASAVDFAPLPVVTIGQELSNRGSRDSGTGNMFAAEVFGFSEGRAVDWSIRGSATPYTGTRNITPVILEQTGTGGLGDMTIRGIGTTRALSYTTNVQTFNFGLVSGSDQMGPRHYLGWIDSDGVSAGNQGIISYSGGDHFTLLLGKAAPIGAGNTHGVSQNLNRRYSLQATFDVGSAQVVGNGASQRAHTDAATGAVFVLDEPFTKSARLSQWAFWSWSPGDRWITPLIMKEIDGSYVLQGVGASRLVPATQGTITYDFDLQMGDDLVGEDCYFGWVDALVRSDGTAARNQGLIRYAADETFRTQVRWFGGGPGTFTPGADFGGGQYLARAYAVQAIAIVPEPATLALLGLAACGLGRYVRRRRA